MEKIYQKNQEKNTTIRKCLRKNSRKSTKTVLKASKTAPKIFQKSPRKSVCITPCIRQTLICIRFIFSIKHNAWVYLCLACCLTLPRDETKGPKDVPWISWEFTRQYPEMSRTYSGFFPGIASNTPWFVFHKLPGFFSAKSEDMSACMHVCILLAFPIAIAILVLGFIKNMFTVIVTVTTSDYALHVHLHLLIRALRITYQ